MNKSDIVILGAGLMGRAAAYFFVNHPAGPFRVRLADKDASQLNAATTWLASDHVQPLQADAASEFELAGALNEAQVCISCVPYFLNLNVARAAIRAGVSMIDLGGNPQVTDMILSLDADVRRKKLVFIPDTGLAPGLTNILAWELAHRFQTCDAVHIRVGGLPQKPEGRLNYAQVFSIHGLLNEYLEDARELDDGKEIAVPSPSKLETLEFDGLGTFEAFVTAGGASTLPLTLKGSVRRLDYKTIRYAGHYEAVTLLRDLGLTSTEKQIFATGEVTPRQMLTRVLEKNLPQDVPDIILLQVTATGDGGRKERIELAVRHDAARGISAMGQMTAFPAAAIALAILQNKVEPGAHPQEKVIPFAWMKEQLGLFGIGL